MITKVLTERQVYQVQHNLLTLKVTTLKKICTNFSVPATWYNHARKTGLVSVIAFQIDKYGLNLDQFSILKANYIMPFNSRIFDELSDKKTDHNTQFFVRGDLGDITKVEEMDQWSNYYPRKSNGSHSNTVMPQQFNPKRYWLNDIEDPEGYFNTDDSGNEDYVPEKEPDFESVKTLRKYSEDEAALDMDALKDSVKYGKPDSLETALSAVVLGSIGGKIEEIVSDMGVTKNSILKMVEKIVHEGIKGKVIPIPEPKEGGPKLSMVHMNYEAAEFWMTLGFSVYLNGPAGSGKTVAAIQLAESFEQEIQIIPCHGEMTVYDLVGFTDGNGNYKATEFFKAWRDGKIILMDEVDKAPGEVNVLLNAGLAQGTITFPNGTLNRKETTKLIFTGNTKMSGADALYSAGQRQDASFSNRMITVDWPFDPGLEQMLAENECERFGGDKAAGKLIYNKIIKIRKAIDELGMNYVVGQRQSMAASAGVARGRKAEDVMDEVVYGWMDPNDAKRLKEKTK